MSRTDKDRSYRVRAADPFEHGRYASHYHARRAWQQHLWAESFAEDGVLRECDLPDFHDRQPVGHRSGTFCGWELEHWVFSPFGGSASQDFRRSFWHGPERRRERDGLGEIRKVANAGADLEDVDFNNRQARHSATWAWQ